MSDSEIYTVTKDPVPFSISFSDKFKEMELDECFVIKLIAPEITADRIRGMVGGAKLYLENRQVFRRFRTKTYPVEGVIRVWRIK